MKRFRDLRHHSFYYSILYTVFWNSAGGTVEFLCPDRTLAAAFSSGNLAVIVDLRSGDVTVSDPVQSLVSAGVTLQGRCFGG